jgi:hypothetical protein
MLESFEAPSELDAEIVTPVTGTSACADAARPVDRLNRLSRRKQVFANVTDERPRQVASMERLTSQKFAHVPAHEATRAVQGATQ